MVSVGINQDYLGQISFTNTQILIFQERILFNNNILLLILVIIAATYASELSDFDQLKLDPVEKSLVVDSKMPFEKVKYLLDSEISLTDYFRYPWLHLGITEKEWINQEKAGIIGHDTLFSTKQIKRTQWAVVQNFFVPGLHQYKRKQTGKALAMTGIAVGSLVLYTVHRKDKTGTFPAFDFPIYLAILGADMFWSSIDIGVQINREMNSDSMRFSYLVTIPLLSSN
jgi:hypothetical protein